MGRAVEAVRPGSVFEVAYGSPFYSARLAGAGGARAVAVGVDEMQVDSLYGRAKREGLGVLPLVMDVRSPSPEIGVCGQTSGAAVGRLFGDLVIALDVTHVLGVRYRFNFDQMARALGAFARRAVLVDFVEGREHPATRAYWNEDFGWYSVQNFEGALRRRFAKVERIEGERPTFLCFMEGAR
jgi:hypothetical protein